jgi:predicted  nucleic acid-binding Zn-ribbon protein
MTIDERFERLEHFSVAWREESRKELAQHRELWRDTQRQINELSRKIADISDALVRFQAEADRQMTALREEDRKIRQEMAERDRKTDQRIQELVSSIGELVKRLPAK